MNTNRYKSTGLFFLQHEIVRLVLGLIKSPVHQVPSPPAETERPQHEANYSPPSSLFVNSREQIDSGGAGGSQTFMFVTSNSVKNLRG
jgi:hypothetical protein